MKRAVVVTIHVETAEYQDAEDTDLGAILLVSDMLRGGADLPKSDVTIACGSAQKRLDEVVS